MWWCSNSLHRKCSQYKDEMKGQNHSHKHLGYQSCLPNTFFFKYKHQCFDHPVRSPDLAPVWLFVTQANLLERVSFWITEKSTITKTLKGLLENYCTQCFQASYKWWNLWRSESGYFVEDIHLMLGATHNIFYLMIQQYRTPRFQLIFINKRKDADIMLTANRRGNNCMIVINNFLQSSNRHRSSSQVIYLGSFFLQQRTTIQLNHNIFNY